jgi:hypothetical protein
VRGDYLNGVLFGRMDVCNVVMHTKDCGFGCCGDIFEGSKVGMLLMVGEWVNRMRVLCYQSVSQVQYHVAG